MAPVRRRLGRPLRAAATAMAVTALLLACTRAEQRRDAPREEQATAPPPRGPNVILRVEFYSDLAELSDASDLIVVARAAAQGPGDPTLGGGTLTTLEVLDTLKGRSAERITLHGMLPPPDSEGYVGMEQVADPPSVGETYVFHLEEIMTPPDAEGVRVPPTNRWVAKQFGHYRALGGGHFELEPADLPDDLPRRLTLSQLASAARS